MRRSRWRFGAASNRSALIPRIVPVVVAIIISLGCGGGKPTGDEARARAALRMVGIEYGRYLVANNGAPPPDEAAMRTFLDLQISRTPNYGVASADELLSSTRDGKPLQLICGAKVAPPDRPEALWAAYEQTGVDGRRLVVNTRGDVVELDAEAFDRDVPLK